MAGEPDNHVDLIRQYLAERTIGCPVCRYNLRGVSGSSCPECGTKLQLRLNTLDIRLGPWLLGVISVAMALGFSSILGTTAAVGAWRAWRMGQNFSWYRPWTQFDTITLASLGGMTLLYLMMLGFIIRRRSKFLARSRFEQWLRSITLALILGALQVGLMYLWSRTSTS